MSWIEKEFNIKGIATDVNTFEWEEEDWVNKAPVVLTKVAKRPGGFTLHMKGITQDLEWYFSKGLTNIYFKDNGKTLRIEHEDGTYYVDLQASKELYEFLKEFVEEEESV